MANRPEAAADPVDVAVGARIRLLRKVRGLSQQALAEAAGFSSSSAPCWPSRARWNC